MRVLEQSVYVGPNHYAQFPVIRLAVDLLHALAAPLLPAGERPPEAAEAAAAFDRAERRDAFIRYAPGRALGPSTAAIVHAADRRGIPWIRLDAQSPVQLGCGRHQQRIHATVTGRTPHIAVEIAGDKEQTNTLLANLGLPVPRQALVYDAEEAEAEAARIGYPVVVKPYNGNHGRGVSVGLTTAASVRGAFALAAEHADAVLAETFIAGRDHRMLVGDGVRTVAELVAALNADPRRGIGHEKVLTQIRVLSPDITCSYKDAGGAICEVNAAPGFRMHMAPSAGKPRDVAARVVEMLFPPNKPATVPIAAITGTNGKTTTARMLAHLHKLAERWVGLTTTDGVYVDGQRTVEGDMTGPTSARIMLGDPSVDVAVLETARGGLLRAGTAMRRVDVGAVLNADDPLTVRMAAHTEARHVCYVTMDPGNALVGEHIRAWGRAVALVKAGIAPERVEVIVSETAAIDAALAMARAGDLVIICADVLDRGWQQIVDFGARATHRRGRDGVGGGRPRRARGDRAARRPARRRARR